MAALELSIDTEHLVDKADLICDPWLADQAVSAADHAHDCKALDRGSGVFIVWKPHAGRMTRLGAP